jgi:hypothetical protein
MGNPSQHPHDDVVVSFASPVPLAQSRAFHCLKKMSYSSIALLRIDRKIKVASTLLDITRQIYGMADANLLQHLAELTSSRHAVAREACAPPLAEITYPTQGRTSSPTYNHNHNHNTNENQRFTNAAPTYPRP